MPRCHFIERPETPEEKYEREHRSRVFNVFENGNEHSRDDEPLGSMILLNIEETEYGCKAVLDLTNAELVPQFFNTIVQVHYGYDIEIGGGRFDVHPPVEETDEAFKQFESVYKMYEENVPRIYGGTFYDHVFRLYQDWKDKPKAESLTSAAL